MVEGRKTQVALIDGRQLDIIVQPRLSVPELLNIVASHCHLKEPDKQYFGLAFIDEKQQSHWLYNERRVLDHEFPRKCTAPGATLILYHLIKLFVDSVTHLTHPPTVELFFIHASSQIHKGLIYAGDDSVFRLAALHVQICCGDFIDRQTAVNCLRRLPLFPAETLKRFSICMCEEKVLEIYCELQGMQRGTAIIKYMECVERLPTYGVHFFDVKDKVGNSHSLAISKSGIFQYAAGNRNKPVKGFLWRQLENLYYRDRKFSVEIQEAKRVVHTVGAYDDMISEAIDENDELTMAVKDPTTQVSVSRRAFLPSQTRIYVYFCDSPQLCKSIWYLTIAQHQFSSDQKSSHKKTSALPAGRLIDLLNSDLRLIKTTPSVEICNQTASPAARRLLLTDRSTSDSGVSISSQSVQSVPYSCLAEKTEEERKGDRDRCILLKSTKRTLEKRLAEKLAELKSICIEEGNLVGQLPPEIRRCLAPGEREPKIQRRVGTCFSIPLELINNQTKVDHIQQLEADIEVQKKIVTAALKLANDCSVSKLVRKMRMSSYNTAQTRLRKLDQQLLQLRLSSSKPDISVAGESCASGEALKSSTTSSGRFTKSAPNTPMGSSADLTSDDTSVAVVDGTPTFAIPKLPHLQKSSNGQKRLPKLSLMKPFCKKTNTAFYANASTDKFAAKDSEHPNIASRQELSTSENYDDFPSTARSNDTASSSDSGVSLGNFSCPSKRRHQAPVPVDSSSASLIKCILNNSPSIHRRVFASDVSTTSSTKSCGGGGADVAAASTTSSNSNGATSSSSKNMGVLTKAPDDARKPPAATSSPSFATMSQRCHRRGVVVGAYNLPNRRTSWDFDGVTPPGLLGALMSSSESLDGVAVPSAAAAATAARTFTPRLPPTIAVGSLDRRFVKTRRSVEGRSTRVDPDLTSLLASNTSILSLDHSPPRYGQQNWLQRSGADVTMSSAAASCQAQMTLSNEQRITTLHRVEISPVTLHRAHSTLPKSNSTLSSRVESHRRSPLCSVSKKDADSLYTLHFTPQSTLPAQSTRGSEGFGASSLPGVVVESCKPYETADFVKYSERLRQSVAIKDVRPDGVKCKDGVKEVSHRGQNGPVEPRVYPIERFDVNKDKLPSSIV